jgi:ssRNA-specific RNase YbeY (16S rRNA maturation enzyme)
MGLVTLITDLEESIEEKFGVSLVLADDRAMSQKRSPFRSVSSLTQYISSLMQEERQNEGS